MKSKFIVIVDGEVFSGDWNRSDDAWRWAIREFPVAHAQDRVRVTIIHFV